MLETRSERQISGPRSYRVVLLSLPGYMLIQEDNRATENGTSFISSQEPWGSLQEAVLEEEVPHPRQTELMRP